jgi:CheY-like chemotaxis protein
MTSLLLDEVRTPDQRKSIETIRRNGQNLIFLINGILDFTKIDEGKVELENQPFEMRRCIEDSLDLRAGMASKKGLELFCTFDRDGGDIPEVIMGDPTRLRQVLGNLLDNAIKFTDKGVVQVFVSSKEEGDCSQIHFAVKDTGIGIPQDQMHKLFLPFSQVDCTSTTKYAGTGLGLAISKELVELMGGRIWVESDLGRGSTFHFTILAREAKGMQTTANSINAKESLPVGPLASLRILLAEDNEINQLVMQKMLKRLGYRADMAANGIEAIQALERQPYDIVLMDVKMPEMDGLQASRIIRRLWPQGPKIIAITAYALQGDKERCLEAGMDSYISKPVMMEELAEMLRNMGSRRI